MGKPPWGIAQTRSDEQRKRALPSPARCLSNHCHEPVVESLNENGAEKSD